MTTKVKPMRSLLVMIWLSLCTLALAKPISDKYGFYSVPAPDDWGIGSDPLGLNIPGSAWVNSKDKKSVIGVATLPANTPEEQKMPVEVVGQAMNDQLTAKGFRCTMTATMVSGQPSCVVQGVNKLNQRIAIVVTRRANALAMFFYLTASSTSTDAYGAMLKTLVDGFTWAKAKPATK